MTYLIQPFVWIVKSLTVLALFKKTRNTYVFSFAQFMTLDPILSNRLQLTRFEVSSVGADDKVDNAEEEPTEQEACKKCLKKY
jgi:hypothetical protein